MSTDCDKRMSWADNTTMTDQNADDTKQRGTGPVATPNRPHGRASWPIARAGKRADPTAPEVPSAKRTSTRRRQRSVVLVGSAAMGLVSIALFLLYEAGRHVALSGGSPSASAVSNADGRAMQTTTAYVSPSAARPAETSRSGSTTNAGAPSPSASPPSRQA